MCDSISRPPAEEQTVFSQASELLIIQKQPLLKLLMIFSQLQTVDCIAACDTLSHRISLHVTGIEGSFLGCFKLHLCVKFPSYAVDTQLYLSTNPEETKKLVKL